jgi:hypothetical protein
MYAIYRGYVIHAVKDLSSWSFSARPATPDLSILAKLACGLFASSDAAVSEAKKRIDHLFAI